MLALVGVQSNQYRRAHNIARPLRDVGPIGKTTGTRRASLRRTSPIEQEQGAVGSDLSQAWSLYRTGAMATGVPVDSLIKVLVDFATAAQLEKPLEYKDTALTVSDDEETAPNMTGAHPAVTHLNEIAQLIGVADVL